MKKRRKMGAAAAEGSDNEAEAAAVEPAADQAEDPPRKKKKRPPQAEVEAAAAEPQAEAEDPPRKKKRKPPQAEPEPAPAAADASGKRRSGKALKAAKRRQQAEALAATEEGPPAEGGPPAAAAGGGPGAEPRQAVDRTVFVDGLPYVWTVEKVQEHFEDCGTVVEVRAPTWQDSGRLRGFAHVTFSDVAARAKALKMDGTQVGGKGRYLKIEAAKQPGGAEVAAAADPGRFEGKRRLFVKNLPYDTSESEVLALFKGCGKVVEVRIPTSFGRCKGFAYVEFAASRGLQAAVAMQPPPSLRGRALRLDADEGRGPRAGFHFRPEAIEAGFGPGAKSGGGRGDGGRGGRGGPAKKLSLF